MSNSYELRASRGGMLTAGVSKIVLFACFASVARGQRPAGSGAGVGAGGFEIRPIVTAFLPTGSQRDVLKDAASFGGELAWRFHQNFALSGAFAWAPSRDRTTAIRSSSLFTGREERVDAFSYDLGVEARLPVYVAPSWALAPYASVGGGARTYDYRDIDRSGAETTPVAYGALGIDLVPPTGRIGVRVEARDNVSGFKGLRGEYAERKARNDVQLGGGITIRF